MWTIRVITHYVSWQTADGSFVNELYPNLTYAVSSVTYAGEVPGETGKVYCEVECNSLVRDAMRLDPNTEVVVEVPPIEVEEPVAP
jgi:hypothetical protein